MPPQVFWLRAANAHARSQWIAAVQAEATRSPFLALIEARRRAHASGGDAATVDTGAP